MVAGEILLQSKDSSTLEQKRMQKRQLFRWVHWEFTWGSDKDQTKNIFAFAFVLIKGTLIPSICGALALFAKSLHWQAAYCCAMKENVVSL